MKKITLTLAAIAAAFTMNAQELTGQSIDASAQKSAYSSAALPQGAQTVVYDQPVDQDLRSGMPSFSIEYQGEQAPVFLATHFSLSQQTSIGTITSYGFNLGDNISSNLVGLNVLILPNGNSNLPDIQSAASLYIDAASISGNTFELGPNEQSLVIDVQNYNGGQPIDLPAGEYWLSVSPIIDTGSDLNTFLSDNANYWYWFIADPVDPNAPTAAIWDPVGIFAADAADNFVSAPGSFANQFAFSMDDTGGNLAVTNLDENRFMYYTNENSLILSANTAIKNATVYSILGQQVINKNLDRNEAQVSLEGLTSGIYIAQVQVEGKTKTFKFVKK